MGFSPDKAQARAILLDIEGTTTPGEFVYQVLFPYARKHLGEFLEQHQRSPSVISEVAALQSEQEADVKRGLNPPAWRQGKTQFQSAEFYVHWLMDHDRKSTALKSLQGKIWQAGYESGELKGEVYPDVPRALERWRELGRRVCIFSSGSVLAQKLLFANTTVGDLTPLISAYLDTTIGPKVEAESYRRIATTLDLPSQEILFLSDAHLEVEAARTAGMQSLLCARDAQLTEAGNMSVIRTFDELFPEGTAKHH